MERSDHDGTYDHDCDEPSQETTQNKIADLESRIQTQRRMIEGFQTLRNATPNQDVIRQAETNIRQAQNTISYLEESLAAYHRRHSVDLSGLQMQMAAGLGPSHDASMRTPIEAGLGAPSPMNAEARRSSEVAGTPLDSSAAYRGSTAGLPGAATGLQASALERDTTTSRRNYSALDLLRSDTPLTRAKIQRKLNQLEYKLEVERQTKQGFDKIARLYQAEGDRRSKADAEAQRTESTSKLVLIQQALKQYQQLDFRDDDELPFENPYAARRAHKPLTGTLSIAIKAAKDLNHAPMPSNMRTSRESFVTIKIEDTERVQTHASRTDQWSESFRLPIENTTEVELTIQDRVGTANNLVPVGLVWIRINDIVDHLRKVRVGQIGADGTQPSPALSNSEWVTADAMPARTPGASGAAPMQQQQLPAAKPDQAIEGWFTVEPTGALYLRLHFEKHNATQHKLDAGLGRQGAVRKRREEVSVVNGHQFVQRQFYQMIRCALCGELVLNASVSQCQNCNYTCHRKCAQKVFTRCVTQLSSDADQDEVKLNHRIPHRWEPFTNIGANWCCHCGTMLSLGRRTNRKCSECDLTCHADCASLVPNFCGMSMEMANQVLSNIATIQKNRSSGRSPGVPPSPHGSTPMTGSPGHSTGRLSVPNSLPASRRTSSDLPVQGMQAMTVGAVPGTPPRGASPRPLMPSNVMTGRSPAPLAPTAVPAVSPQAAPLAIPANMASNPPQAPMPAQARPAQATPSPPSQPGPGTPTAPATPTAKVVPMTPTSANAKQAAAFVPAKLPPGGMTPSPKKVVSQLTAPPATTIAGELPSSSQRQVTLNDFNFLAVLGKGNFGKVMLAEEKHTGNLYAIKVLKKEFIIENDEIDSTRSEKRVFLTAAREQHPFLLNLHSCFQTETRVYFVMEYVSGGDLMLHIQREQFNLHRARFYAAEVLLALEYFHKHGIIYRDLKLDNIMLTLDGHVKIADYGLCKEGMWYGNTTTTFCGTPEFMAPEILLEQRYDRAVDWWAFGILLYEMLLGQAPFRGDDEDEIFDAILEDEPLYPIQMPRDSVSLLQRLLTRDPSRRLGSGPNDADDIKAHPFFRDINWDDLLHKRVTPPFLPTIKNASDTTWFDTEVCSMISYMLVHERETDLDAGAQHLLAAGPSRVPRL